MLAVPGIYGAELVEPFGLGCSGTGCGWVLVVPDSVVRLGAGCSAWVLAVPGSVVRLFLAGCTAWGRWLFPGFVGWLFLGFVVRLGGGCSWLWGAAGCWLFRLGAGCSCFVVRLFWLGVPRRGFTRWGLRLARPNIVDLRCLSVLTVGRSSVRLVRTRPPTWHVQHLLDPPQQEVE